MTRGAVRALIVMVVLVAACTRSDTGATQDRSPPTAAEPSAAELTAQERSGATVTVDAFSGRANPTFELSDEETRQLEQMLDGLTVIEGERPPFDELGFRRFVVSGVRYHEEPSGLSVTSDLVVPTGSDAMLSDPDASLYNFLRSKAEGHLANGELGAIPAAG